MRIAVCLLSLLTLQLAACGSKSGGDAPVVRTADDLLGIWVPDAFRYGAAGLAGGCALGIIGLWLTKWEPSREALFYTPSRWLALFLTLAIAARVAYGWWRGLHASGPHPFLSASGMQLSLAVGGGLIGYYFAYAIGVRLRLARHEKDHAG